MFWLSLRTGSIAGHGLWGATGLTQTKSVGIRDVEKLDEEVSIPIVTPGYWHLITITRGMDLAPVLRDAEPSVSDAQLQTLDEVWAPLSSLACRSPLIR
ncbi:hypothetical protein ANANG_G00068800, partial [Anguilla anguilla]